LRDLEHRFVVDLVNGLADIYARVKTGKLDRSAFQEAVEDHFFAFGIRQLNRRSLQYLTKVEFISERGGPVNFAAEAVESVLGTGASARSIFEWRKAGGRPNHGHRERRRQLLERLLFVAHLLQWVTRRSDWILLREVEILTRWRLRKFPDRPLPKPPLN
ncbi:hypothetical protein, partial [Myxococcus virescens]|uniref:hypothetical protein n=1 Tax=Myxococcus virescens TaxID=83456 RepID=UPI001C992C9A